ncbi:MAG: family transcriptional regulator [Mycobacterium sp.]|nr:family transcriptional regulator [Mycobacterium sp.]
MANERLRAALQRRGVTVEAAALAADVDPKTVHRWLGGRVPHPQHRYAVAKLTHEDEEFLWPGAARASDTDARDAAAELVRAYAYRSDVEPAQWWRLISGATSQIDLLGYTLYFLPQQHPEFVPTLREKCGSGCRLRIAVASPDSAHVRYRDEEEHEEITLVARIRTTLRALEPLRGCGGLELRYQDVPLYNSVFRFDDEMLVTPHLYGTPGHSAPLMHLRRLGPGGLFARFAGHFDKVWEHSVPVPEWVCPNAGIAVR